MQAGAVSAHSRQVYLLGVVLVGCRVAGILALAPLAQVGFQAVAVRAHVGGRFEQHGRWEVGRCQAHPVAGMLQDGAPRLHGHHQ